MEISTHTDPVANPDVVSLIQAKQAEIAQKTAEEKPKTSAAQEAGKEDSTQKKNSAELSPEQQKVVDQLRARDREVRDHEQAHKRVGGPYASQPTYSYQTGPDGKRYAIGGQVMIDASPVPENPEATIAKMTIVKAAALAPAEPSSTDRSVAAMADAQIMQAQADLNAERSAELNGDGVDLRV